MGIVFYSTCKINFSNTENLSTNRKCISTSSLNTPEICIRSENGQLRVWVLTGNYD